jgi:hypothetical protein
LVASDNKDLADHLRKDKVEDADKDLAQAVLVVVLAVQEVPVLAEAAQEVPAVLAAPVVLAQNAPVVQISSSLS